MKAERVQVQCECGADVLVEWVDDPLAVGVEWRASHSGNTAIVWVNRLELDRNPEAQPEAVSRVVKEVLKEAECYEWRGTYAVHAWGLGEPVRNLTQEEAQARYDKKRKSVE